MALCLLELFHIFHFDFNGLVWSDLSSRLNCLRNTPTGGNMVFLDQKSVIQANSVVLAQMVLFHTLVVKIPISSIY